MSKTADVISDLAEVKRFREAFKDAVDGRPVRDISRSTYFSDRGLGYGRDVSATTIWRYVHGEALGPQWNTYEQILRGVDRLNHAESDVDHLRTLWKDARKAAAKVRAAERARVLATTDPDTYQAVQATASDSHPPQTEPERPTDRGTVTIRGGQVVITDPAVISGRRIEISDGEVHLTGAAVERAGDIVITGGKVILGDQTAQPATSSDEADNDEPPGPSAEVTPLRTGSARADEAWPGRTTTRRDYPATG